QSHGAPGLCRSPPDPDRPVPGSQAGRAAYAAEHARDSSASTGAVDAAVRGGSERGLRSMSTRVFNPEALTVARESRRRSQDEVARAANVTQGLISKAENGVVSLTPEEV